MNQNKTGSPKPAKITRKLKLSKETVAPLATEVDTDGPYACTKRATGCPIHTC